MLPISPARIMTLAASMAATLSLAACGGGGGTAGLPDHPITDRAAARALVGGQPLDMTSEAIGGELERIANGSDSLLSSDLHLVTNATRARLTAHCAGASCTFSHPSVPGESLEVGISDWELHDEYQAVMTSGGIPIAQSRSSADLTTGYGGWLEHSGFGAIVQHDATAGEELTAPYAVSYGDASGTNPAGAGTATWSGVMVGSDVGSATATERPDQVQGDATVTADLDNADVDVAFTRIVNLGTGGARADMTWTGLPLSDGGFGQGSGENRIEGRFYGPNHEEAGGIFERDRIVGAFGARREEDHGSAGLPDYPVTDRAAARTLAGGQPLDTASEGIRGELDRVANGADSLLSSDVHLITDATRERVTADCAGASCTLSHPSAPSESAGIPDLPLYDEYQAVMTRNGIPIAQARNSADLAIGYGGWLDHNVFGAVVEHDATVGEELMTPYAVSYGDASGTNPAGVGTATWSGVMVGADLGSATATERPDHVQGDATVTADLDNADVDVAFTRIVNLGTGGARADMTWTGLPLSDGGFGQGSGENRIEGRFYGPNHEEAGGIFERDRIVGAFGARRQ